MANRPGGTYNPLFIYGGVGLGKTHLLHAIVNQALSINSSLKVCYVTIEKFTNELINSIRNEKMAEFRKRYRNIDILLNRRYSVYCRQSKHAGRIFSHL